MKILKVDTYRISVPLIKPFKTALRQIDHSESVIVKITCENGITGWGEAAPVPVITGEFPESTETAIHRSIKPFIMGKSLFNYEVIFQGLQKMLIGNPGAKAAIDMALFDCLSQYCGLPLYQFLGGFREELETNMTVSVNDPKEMGEDAVSFLTKGFPILKVKAGKEDPETDIRRIVEIRKRIGGEVPIRIDVNQGWKPKEAIRAIRKMEDMDLNIELVEQPVPAYDIKGLKWVTDSVYTPVMADESVYTAKEALTVVETRSVDFINIKLMKAGGIYQAGIINRIAEASGVECMIGSMIETRLGITAAAHFAASQKNIRRFDLDAPLMLAKDMVVGGVVFKGNKITFPDKKGLGIENILTGSIFEKRED